MSWPVGSTWGKWDLHVHTPASIVNHYPGDGEEAWASFLDDLEALPQDFRVLGINDYLFLDGYRRVLQERARGRLQNLDAVLPVVELRLDRFGGTEGHWRRVNLHVVFSEDLDPDVIQAQFLNALVNRYTLLPPYQGRADWQGVITLPALEDLGRQIKATVPAARLAQFDSDLQEGFNHLTVTLQNVQDALDKPMFRNKHLLAVGKAEWASMQWNNQSIADKKNVINTAEIVFTASESPAAFHAGRKRLTAEGVNDHLLDCSDAHSLSTSQDKDRVGNCSTWINAAPTFDGLRHAMQEYEDRVFVGDRPPLLERLAATPTRYIRSVRVAKRADVQSDHAWFDADVELNPGFSVIYGGKGQGKSALADIIALAGRSSRIEHFSFLHRDRFRNPRTNPARAYEVTLNWHSGPPEEVALDEDPQPGTTERVQYIPQNFLEEVCNEVSDGDPGLFTQELNRVVFLHVPEEARLGQENLETLLDAHSRPLLQHVDQLRSQMAQLNRRITDLEEQLRPENQRRLQSNVDDRERELSVLNEQRPSNPVPAEGPADGEAVRQAIIQQIEAHRARSRELEAAAEETRREIAQLNAQDAAVTRIEQRLSNLVEAVDQFRQEAHEDLELIAVSEDDLLSFEVRRGPLAQRQRNIAEARVAARARVDRRQDQSFVALLGTEQQAIEQLTYQLDEPNRRYQAARQALTEWEAARDRLVGAPDDPGSLEGARASLARLATIPVTLDQLRAERLALTRAIHGELRRLADVYRTVYQPVEQFVAESAVIREAMSLNFEVSLTAVRFHDEFLDQLNLGVSGSFMGRDEGRRLSEQLLERVDLDSEDGVAAYVTKIDDHLRHDRRPGVGRDTFVADQLRTRRDPAFLYDFVFGLGYIEPRFVLQSQGRPLDQLSPGEKGTLLLAFYLLVDQRDVPLIIDQPEENLDNQTVYQLLVNALKSAKSRRQLIVVTHNPNLAVVGDADQFIHARKDHTHFAYESGPLESLETNERVVQVLEGTRPAFLNRRDKYLGND